MGRMILFFWKLRIRLIQNGWGFAKSISLSGELKIKVGKLITVNSVIHTPEAKQDLGEKGWC
ncbi:MAG: hypothetical protein CM1200mP16_12420 [Nitrospina sp.]|nr:MAG: hypothetical protein CM1200mP16_12420 [Nitrospina sp.]